MADKKPELSMEIRLLIAFALMGLVLFLTPSLFSPPKPAEKKAAAPAAQTPPKPEEKPKEPAPVSLPAKTTTAAPAVAAPGEQTIIIETPLYKVVFSNRGAVVRSWELKKYKDQNRKPVDVATRSPEAAQKACWPGCYPDAKDWQATSDLNQMLFVASQPDPLSVEFRFSDGRTSATKTYRFSKDHYRVRFTSEVTVDGKSISHRLAWRGGFGDRTVHSAASSEHSVYYDADRGKLVLNSAKDASKGPVAAMGNFAFAGLQDTYFAALFLAPPGTTTELQTWSDSFVTPESQGKEEPHVGVALGGEGKLSGTIFVGPKDLDILRATDPRLEQLIDFGWFFFIAKPLFLAMHWVDQHWISNWGWNIVFVTVVINVLMLPLRFTSLKSQRKMQKIQPQLNAINAKYKGISMRDPRTQQKQQEMMELYQKHGINPAAGCVPLLLQMPFFFAFYKVLNVVIELRGASWLWVTDLSQPEPGFLRWLPILMLVTQVAMQKMTPTAPGADPNQQRMMMLMPLILFIPFYQASAGLVLYWLTGNVIGIVQQYFFNKIAPVHPAPPPEPERKKKRR